MAVYSLPPFDFFFHCLSLDVVFIVECGVLVDFLSFVLSSDIEEEEEDAAAVVVSGASGSAGRPEAAVAMVNLCRFCGADSALASTGDALRFFSRITFCFPRSSFSFFERGTKVALFASVP